MRASRRSGGEETPNPVFDLLKHVDLAHGTGSPRYREHHLRCCRTGSTTTRMDNQYATHLPANTQRRKEGRRSYARERTHQAGRTVPTLSRSLRVHIYPHPRIKTASALSVRRVLSGIPAFNSRTTYHLLRRRRAYWSRFGEHPERSCST